jgi:1-acyl-sn-glycerol-3-phosphate acyltransferase
MVFFEFIFLKRQWECDESTLIQNLKQTRQDGFPLWLLIFPEGTNITPDTRQKSLLFAKKRDLLERPRHVLLPRSTGLFTCLKELNQEDYVSQLADVTLSFSNVQSTDVPQYVYPLSQLFLGKSPKKVFLHIHMYSIPIEISGFIEKDKIEPISLRKKEFDAWLRNVYMKKDDLLDRFYKDQQFEKEQKCQVIQVIPRLLDILYVTSSVLCFVLGFYYFYYFFTLRF